MGQQGRVLAALLLAASGLGGCGDSSQQQRAVVVTDRRLAGGDTTIFTTTSNAFSTPAPNLTEEELENHLVGDAAFDASFVTSPAPVNAGLGALFNDKSCVACHARDGRGRPPEEGEAIGSMLLKISVGNDPVTGPEPAPGFGTQLQHRGIFGAEPEARIEVHYDETIVELAGGEQVSLRTPTFEVVSSYIELPKNVRLSPRVGPPVFGRGLLEAITDQTLLGLADESDRDNDGVTGRPNLVFDAAAGGLRIGRFGVKAGNPTLLGQIAGAYHQDMGITSSVFPIESIAGQPQDGDDGDDPELADEVLDSALFYMRTLAVPARRDVDDSQVLRGEELFAEAGCAACHVPALRTGDADGFAALANQVIQPFSDLLLHDMGEGLADDRGEFEATGREWRTPPLWGIGLTHTVQGHTFLLHDGRARNVLEAILWHGGEAKRARERMREMSAEDRAALLRFLDSL